MSDVVMRASGVSKVFGATHAQVGAYLLGLWGLPEPVVSTVELHHSLLATASRGFTPVTAIHVAQSLDGSRPNVNRLDSEYLKQLGLKDRVSAWQDALVN